MSVLGMTSAWLLALALGSACLVGLIVGFFVRPYLSFGVICCYIMCVSIIELIVCTMFNKFYRQEGSGQLHHFKTWKHFLVNLVRTAVILCFDSRSAIVSSTSYAVLRRLIILSLSHVTLIFSLSNVELRKRPSYPASLIDDNDFGSSTTTKSQIYADQLNDLVCFDGEVESLHTITSSSEQTHGTEEPRANFCSDLGKIERMIHANLFCFTEPTESSVMDHQVGSSTSAIKKNGSKQDKLL